MISYQLLLYTGRSRIVTYCHFLFASRNKFASEKALNCFSQREILETPHVVSYLYRCLWSLILTTR